MLLIHHRSCRKWLPILAATLLLSLPILLGGCRKLEPISSRIVSGPSVSINENSLITSFTLQVYNPNKRKITIQSIHLKVFLRSSSLGTLTLVKPVSFAGEQESLVKIPLRLKFRLPADGLRLMMLGEIPSLNDLEAEGYVWGRYGILWKKIHIKRSKLGDILKDFG